MVRQRFRTTRKKTVYVAIDQHKDWFRINSANDRELLFWSRPNRLEVQEDNVPCSQLTRHGQGEGRKDAELIPGNQSALPRLPQ